MLEIRKTATGNLGSASDAHQLAVFTALFVFFSDVTNIC